MRFTSVLDGSKQKYTAVWMKEPELRLWNELFLSGRHCEPINTWFQKMFLRERRCTRIRHFPTTLRQISSEGRTGVMPHTIDDRHASHATEHSHSFLKHCIRLKVQPPSDFTNSHPLFLSFGKITFNRSSQTWICLWMKTLPNYFKYYY